MSKMLDSVERRRRAKGTSLSSPATAQFAAAKRTRGIPIEVTGISEGKLVDVKTSDFHLIDIDDRYQRYRINVQVSKLVEALRKGGTVPDPVTLVQRKWKEEGAPAPSAKLWIIDGQQRVYAFFELDRPFRAMVHESDSLDAERRFFLAMQEGVAVGPNMVIRSWDGPIGRMLRHLNEDKNSDLCGRIHFATGNRDRISASVLARGIATLMRGSPTTGKITEVLSYIDAGFRENSRHQAMATAYLRLVMSIFPAAAPSPVVKAVALVARKRWERVVDMPKGVVVGRLAKLPWAALAPGLSERFMPVLTTEIERVWK